jgi:hypothetical protein
VEKTIVVKELKNVKYLDVRNAMSANTLQGNVHIEASGSSEMLVPFTKLHSVTSEMTVIFIIIAV